MQWRWPPSTGNRQLPAVQKFVLKRAPNIGMLIIIHCSSLATFLVWPAEVTAWNCVSYTKLSQCTYWEMELHFRGLWFTLMPTNFHSFCTPLHCGILPSQQKLLICLQQNFCATKWKEGNSLWVYCGDDCRNYGDKLITIATLHQSSNSVCLKGSKVNIKCRLHSSLQRNYVSLYGVFSYECTVW